MHDELWREACVGIAQRGAHVLRTGRWHDVSFEAGGATFEAHRLILAMASPVFEAMLYGALAERSARVKVIDVDAATFELLLRYAYTDAAELGSVDAALSLYYAADKYMVSGLKRACVTYARANLQPGCALRAYEFASLHDERELADAALAYCRVHASEVLADEALLEANATTVAMLLSQTHLNVADETEVTAAAARYSASHGDAALVVDAVVRVPASLLDELPHSHAHVEFFLQRPFDAGYERLADTPRSLRFKFNASEDVVVVGVQVATQVLVERDPVDGDGDGDGDTFYQEDAYYSMSDEGGARISGARLACPAPFGQLVRVNFATPVAVEKRKNYVLEAYLNSGGYYPRTVNDGDVRVTYLGVDFNFSFFDERLGVFKGVVFARR